MGLPSNYYDLHGFPYLFIFMGLPSNYYVCCALPRAELYPPGGCLQCAGMKKAPGGVILIS